MPAPPPDDDEAWEAVLPSPLYGLWGGGARPARDLVRATLRTHGAIAEFKRLYRQVPAGRRKRDGDVFYEVLPTLAQQAADLDVRRIIDAADENDTTQRLAAQQARQDQARQERERNRQRCAANIEQQEGANRG